jgi:hypothetical protein
MKTLTSAALAGAIAVSAVAAATTGASADKWHHPPHYSGGVNPGAALAAGAFLGFALGALATPYYSPYPYAYYPPPPPPAPVYYPRLSSAHVSWCTNAYGAWYNPATDTWMDAYGVMHRCMAPY